MYPAAACPHGDPTGSTQRAVALRLSIVNKMADKVTRKRFHIPDKEEISFTI